MGESRWAVAQRPSKSPRTPRPPTRWDPIGQCQNPPCPPIGCHHYSRAVKQWIATLKAGRRRLFCKCPAGFCFACFCLLAAAAAAASFSFPAEIENKNISCRASIRTGDRRFVLLLYELLQYYYNHPWRVGWQKYVSQPKRSEAGS